ncbi:hypothetical protein N1495_00890 [Streptococcus didelphis]|uniref:Uncharacterized protein n=1 Tax=Streptococcus didelphis TaxID=102886 RepID=A0ABY9LIB1_9STRE|nr:hypothetical protein [Streptococcus didelphis]WMB27900.1 hypothetical protein N1496_07680 [Streptococcus didelphis]WMB29628.1 hypothetical protein N1495_00890 [Streptococcus didelphis]
MKEKVSRLIGPAFLAFLTLLTTSSVQANDLQGNKTRCSCTIKLLDTSTNNTVNDVGYNVLPKSNEIVIARNNILSQNIQTKNVTRSACSPLAYDDSSSK